MASYSLRIKLMALTNPYMPTSLTYFMPLASYTGFLSAPQIIRAYSCPKSFAFAVRSQKLSPHSLE